MIGMGGEPCYCSSDQERAVDIDVENTSPGVDRVLDRQLRLGNSSKAEKDIDTAECVCDFMDGSIDALFIRHIHFPKADIPFGFLLLSSFHIKTLKMFYSLHSHILINIQNRQTGHSMFKQRSGADKTQSLCPASHYV